MAQSLARFHPDLAPYTAIADIWLQPPGSNQAPLNLVSLNKIGLRSLNALAFGLRREQLAVVTKPALIAHLLDSGFDTVIYIDPDMLVASNLSSVIQTVAESSVTLTPHLLDEVSPEWELQILLSGTFNAGFIGVTSRGRDFASWWLDRTLENPEHDVAAGIYFDQRWLCLAPSMFEDVTILRDPGVNVAYWNMTERRIERRGGDLFVGESPVRLIHFSGFDVTCPEQSTVHFGRFPTASFGPETQRAFREYAAAVTETKRQLGITDEYAFATFKSGEPIPDIVRLIYRGLGNDAARFGDPFDDTHPNSFTAWLNSPVSGAKIRSGPAITNLWERIYLLRPDVQAAYPDTAGKDREGFIAWTRSSGMHEYGLGDGFAI